MLRVASTLFSTGFFATSGHTAVTLSSNGDTAQIIVETFACVVLMSAVLYCRNRYRLRLEDGTPAPGNEQLTGRQSATS